MMHWSVIIQNHKQMAVGKECAVSTHRHLKKHKVNSFFCTIVSLRVVCRNKNKKHKHCTTKYFVKVLFLCLWKQISG